MSDALPLPTSPESLPQLSDAEALTNDLKKLLVHSEDALDREGMRGQVERLEHWVESYRRGLSAAQKVSEAGPSLLHEVRDNLRLSLEELHRLEDEGGNTSSVQHVEQADELTKAIQDIDRILPNVESGFLQAKIGSGDNQR